MATESRLNRSKEHAVAIMAHAEAHYDDGGWDVIVECWSLKQITEFLIEHKITNFAEALAEFTVTAEMWADRQADARNSAF